MISSSLGGTSGLSRAGGVGFLFKISLKITAVVRPANAGRPVAIS